MVALSTRYFYPNSMIRRETMKKEWTDPVVKKMDIKETAAGDPPNFDGADPGS
jgi:hypothetical protein